MNGFPLLLLLFLVWQREKKLSYLDLNMAKYGFVPLWV